jgi:transcriptional regulator with XRE-family HTH domain
MKAKSSDYKTLTGETIRAAMEKQGLSIADVANSVDTSYESARSIVQGNVVPSKHLIKLYASVLKLSLRDLEMNAIADRIRMRFGKRWLEMGGKNAELEPIERVWDKLSDEHKADVIAICKTYAERDTKLKKVAV